MGFVVTRFAERNQIPGPVIPPGADGAEMVAFNPRFSVAGGAVTFPAAVAVPFHDARPQHCPAETGAAVADAGAHEERDEQGWDGPEVASHGDTRWPRQASSKSARI